ncbi:uncharacterized protein [Primulina eburnea]|uniref:uncharacterized protein n=1 Tax=Primulina eburnea TaxID=1245227 RepID=UPI003C6C5CFF
MGKLNEVGFEVTNISLCCSSLSLSRAPQKMPKSKRNRAVTLSKTKKKGRMQKENVVNSIREAIEKFDSVYVFTFDNMRNIKFKDFRERLKSSSRFFLGSNKVMQVALGRSISDEIKPRLHKISKLLRGDSGILLTSLPKEEVQRIFEEYEDYDFARTGSVATEKVELKEGVVEIVSDFIICEEGKPISPESSRILRLLGIKMATFKLYLVCRWRSEDFEVYKEGLEDSDIESS